MIWEVPAVTHMVGFQVRGEVNAILLTLIMLNPTFKQWLSQHVWVQRGVLAVLATTFAVNIPFHIRGALTAAAPDANQWVSGLFGVSAVTTVIGTLAMLAATINSRDSTVRFPAWWDRFTDRLAILGAAATLAAVPFMLWAVFVHPDFDGIVTIHPVVLVLVVATFTGFGGEALLLLAGAVRKFFKIRVPALLSRWYAKLTKFFTVYSAVTVAEYGMLYQLRELPVLIAGTGVSTLVGLLHLVFTRPHLGRRDKVRQAVFATVLTSVNALAVTALFVGWPDMPIGSAVVSVVAGVAATVLWIWTIRGPPGGGWSGSVLSGGPTSPGGFLPGYGSAARLAGWGSRWVAGLPAWLVRWLRGVSVARVVRSAAVAMGVVAVGALVVGVVPWFGGSVSPALPVVGGGVAVGVVALRMARLIRSNVHNDHWPSLHKEIEASGRVEQRFTGLREKGSELRADPIVMALGAAALLPVLAGAIGTGPALLVMAGTAAVLLAPLAVLRLVELVRAARGHRTDAPASGADSGSALPPAAAGPARAVAAGTANSGSTGSQLLAVSDADGAAPGVSAASSAAGVPGTTAPRRRPRVVRRRPDRPATGRSARRQRRGADR
jgi:hypothetical protein